MSERLEWRKMYAEKNPPGRDTLFLDGIAVGDYYQASGDVYRCRFWTPGRLQGGYERLVLSPDAARSLLLQLVEGARREGNGA